MFFPRYIDPWFPGFAGRGGCGNLSIRPEPARVVGRRGTVGALTETMEGSDTAGRAMFRLEACVRGGAARSARGRVRAGTAENLARLPVDGRRSRIVAR